MVYLIQGILLLSLLEGLVIMAACDGIEGYNRRISAKERQEAFQRMAEKHKILKGQPFCEPDLTHARDDPPFPMLPKSFVTQTEIAFQDNYTVIKGEEMFDGIKNAGVIKYNLAEGIFFHRPNVFQEEIHYSIPDDEALFILGDNACEDEGGENCHPAKLCFGGTIDELSEELKNLLGYSDLNPDQGYMGAAGILQWGPEFGYKYRSSGPCRGMECNIYETCIKPDETEDRVLLTYYWSHPEWTLNIKHQQIPVAIEIMSSGTVDPVTLKPFTMRYDFYDFLREVKPDPADLEPPKDVYCYGMKDGEEPPSTKHYFSYKSETVTGFDVVIPDGDNQTTTVQFTTAINQEEFYDWNQKIATSKFVPRYLFTEESRHEHTTLRVQDFNQGLHYSIKVYLDTCHIRPIENLTSFGDVIVNEDGSVEMLPPWVFSHTDEKLKYTGQHWTRGIDTDVWIGTQRNAIIPILNNSYVWYYASPFMTDMDSLSEAMRENSEKEVRGLKSMDKIPVQFEEYLTLFEALPHKIYNIHQYNDEPPMTHTIDISHCYTEDQMSHFVFDLPGNSLERVKHLRDKLLYATQTVLAEFAVVSSLRINRLVLEERSDVIRVLLTILDKPTVEGDAPGTDLESSGQEAVSKINDALRKREVIIIVPMLDLVEVKGEPVIVTIQPVSTSLTPVTRTSTHRYTQVHNRGYGSGSMAGIAFGMLCVGVLAGAVINVILKRRSDAMGGSTIPRVSMARKSSEMPGGSVYLGGNMADGSDI